MGIESVVQEGEVFGDAGVVVVEQIPDSPVDADAVKLDASIAAQSVRIEAAEKRRANRSTTAAYSSATEEPSGMENEKGRSVFSGAAGSATAPAAIASMEGAGIPGNAADGVGRAMLISGSRIE